MNPYFETERGKLYHGDCLEVMKIFPENHFSSMITDPPYGLSFMGKEWDYDVPKVEVWRECLRVLKPGAHALIFAGSRTQHRMAVNVEDAEFVLKDCIMWIYGSGFPKSTDISKQIDKTAGKEREVIGKSNRHNSKAQSKIINPQGNGGIPDITAPATPEAQTWDGWRTALKPSYEPVIVAMKPNDGTYAQNALKHGVAGLNIDGGRIGIEERKYKPRLNHNPNLNDDNWNSIGKNQDAIKVKGRFPANIILDEEAGRLLDQQSGILKSGENKPTGKPVYGGHSLNTSSTLYNSYSPSSQGGASRFFYCAKASNSDREKFNNHPTVKPLKLMEYLCNLTKTPIGGTVLDPFAGSGTTGLAAHNTQRPWVLIEREESYCEISAKRIEAAANQKSFEDYL
jgi:site-specific DNA-methyltransferase (adenine-specific)